MSTEKNSCTTTPPPPSRAEQAAARGIGERTLLRNLARERAALSLELRKHAANSALLGNRCNQLAELSRSEPERLNLRACAAALADIALAVIGETDSAAPEKGIVL